MARSREQISDEAYNAFIRESAGLNLDMASFPSIKARQNKNAEAGSNFLDPRFAPLSDARPLRLPRALARFANDNHADREVAEVLKRGGVVDGSEGSEGLVHFTVSETGQDIEIEIRHIDGLWTGLVNGTKFNAPTRDGLLSLISRELNNNVRNLTGAELREISILCQTPGQGFYSGVARYVAKKTGRPESEALTDAAVLDNRTAGVYDESVNFCFLAIHGDFSPGADWNEFVAAYARGRHYNFSLLEGAKTAYERQLEEAARQALLSATNEVTQPDEPPTYGQLDQLNDDELAGEFRSVKRERAKMIRAGTYEEIAAA